MAKLPYDPTQLKRELARHYIPATEKDISEMLASVGAKDFADLYSHIEDGVKFRFLTNPERFDADGSYFYLRGDTSHTQDLPGGFEAFGKIQGQASRNPLINSEQFSGGGAATVRGYLESEALGDSGWFLTTEIRTPSLLPSTTRQAKGVEGEETGNEWRFHAFWDGGQLYINDPTPDQIDVFRLSSWGLGTRFTLREDVEGSLEVAWPLNDQGSTSANDPFLLFQMKAGF
jgi:hemolysin activation/secretion protein